jgi:hypothetical protein
LKTHLVLMIEDEAIFIKAVQAADSLPLAIRERAEFVASCERKVLDESYLDFLREQIALEPRGPEWTAVLSKRLAALSPFCGFPMLCGAIAMNDGYCFIRVDPATGLVIHFELPD